MSLNDWADGVIGNTPLSATRLNERDALLLNALTQLARNPDTLFSGSIVRDSNGVATSAQIKWPDGVAGVYSATPSVTWPGATDAYVLTRVGDTTLTFTQPTVTRDISSGAITTRPAITIT